MRSNISTSGSNASTSSSLSDEKHNSNGGTGYGSGTKATSTTTIPQTASDAIGGVVRLCRSHDGSRYVQEILQSGKQPEYTLNTISLFGPGSTDTEMVPELAAVRYHKSFGVGVDPISQAAVP